MIDSEEDAEPAAPSVPETPPESPPEASIIVVGPTGLTKRSAAKELYEAFLRARNPNTLRAYQKDLAAFAFFLKVPSAEAAAAQLITGTAGDANKLALDWRSTMVERKLKPTTINRRLSALRAFVKLARTLGVITWGIDIDGFKTKRYRDTRGSSTDKIFAMIECVTKREDAKGARDAAIVRLLHDRVLRRGEVVSLNREDYDPERGLYLLGKGKIESEWVSVPEEARRALDAWIQHRGDASGPLFTALDRLNAGHRLTGSSVYAIIRRLGQAVGDSTAHPHGLRHRGITNALDATDGDVRRVAQFSRHQDVSTVMIYDDARRDQAGQVAALVSLPTVEKAGSEMDEEELRQATNIRVVRGPHGGLRYVRYDLPGNRHVSRSTSINGLRQRTLAVLEFFRKEGMPIVEAASVYEEPIETLPKTNTARVRCSVRPLNVPVDVDLYAVIRPWNVGARPVDIDPVRYAIEAGRVELDVFHIAGLLSEEERDRWDALSREAAVYVAGSAPHARLAGLGALYLDSRKIERQWNGDYDGGRADVSAVDSSIFIECGTLNPPKVMRAMDQGVCLLIVPYGLGCELSKVERQRFVALEGPKVLDIHFGYMFTPKLPPEHAENSTEPESVDAAQEETQEDRVLASLKRMGMLKQ